MDSWHNHLANVIALHTRGKNMAETLNYRSLLKKELSASDIFAKISRAEEIEKLYTKAYRMCKLLVSTQDDESTVNVAAIENNIHQSLLRIQEVKKLLNHKAKKWGFTAEDAEPVTTPDPTLEFAFSDLNAAQDIDEPIVDAHLDVDSMKSEIKESLKSLIDVIDYMEAPTLAKLQKRLDKLVEYSY